jgi:hypothetical protein
MVIASQRGHSPQYNDRSYSHKPVPASASNSALKKNAIVSRSGQRPSGSSYGVLGIGVTGGSGMKDEHHRNSEKKKKVYSSSHPVAHQLDITDLRSI